MTPMTALASKFEAIANCIISSDSVWLLALARKMIVEMSRSAEMNTRTKMLTSIGRISGSTMEKKVRIGPAPQTREECSSSTRDLADRRLHHVNADRHLGDDHDQDQRSQAAIEKRQHGACEDEPEHRYAEQDSGNRPRQPGQQIDDGRGPAAASAR